MPIRQLLSHPSPLIPPMELPEFLRQHRIVVVAVHHGGGRFPLALVDALAKRYPTMVAGTRIDLGQVDLENLFIGTWVRWRNEELGRRPEASIAPGYYLFIDERITAFHPGTVDFDAVGTAGAVASIIGHLTNKPEVTRLGEVLMDAPLTQRVCAYFEPIIDEWVAAELRRAFDDSRRELNEKRVREQREREDEALRTAMIRLGIAETATQQEAKKIWRQVARVFHPDAVVGEDAKRVAHEVFIELERQWQLVCSFKGWK